jgi:glycosyltransferase involved in cell wall biosynthesis
MELAKKSPQLAFCLIFGGSLSPTLAAEIRKQSNIQIVEAVKPQDMRPYYLNAWCLLSTAHAEGFPNTFLEAWEAGVPVASLHVNPGDLLTDSGLGFWAAGRLDGLNAVLQEWANAPEKAIAIGEKGREYVQANHDCNPIKIQLEKVFQH